MPAPQPPDDRQMDRLKALLGIDAETFVRTNLGQYIFDRIANEEDQLVEDLILAAMKSTDQAIMQIALDINMRRTLPIFINEAISAGQAATNSLNQQDDHNDY